MAKHAKASLVSERYPAEMPKGEIYGEMRHQLELVKPEQIEAEWASLRLDLAQSAIEIAEGARYNLSAHAEAQLCDRLKMGDIHNILSPAVYETAEREIEAAANERDGSFILKHRGGIAQAILTDDYKEIPYDASLAVLEDIGARPIRLTLNDTLVRVQAIFNPEDFEPITPRDGEPVSLGIQMRSSDVGASSLSFELFTYRWICSNGMMFGRNNLWKFRTIHLKDRSGTAAQADAEIKRVLELARAEISKRTDVLIGTKLDREKRLQIVNFLGKRNDIGRRAAEALLLPIARAVNVYDVVNILTAEGHNSQHKPSLQMAFESAAGDLMLWAS